MILALDFDGTLVSDAHAYEDLTSPLELMPGALEALRTLKAAGHVILIYSARTNKALTEDWKLNPLWAEGIVPFDEERWRRNLPLNQARLEQMFQFILENLAGLVDAVDVGTQGKPTGVDIFIDDRNHAGVDWLEIAALYGDFDVPNPAQETVPERPGNSERVSRRARLSEDG